MVLKIVDVENMQLDVRKIRRKPSGISQDLVKKTSSIISAVEKLGDRALIDYTYELDGVKLKSIRVSEDEIESAFRKVDSMQMKSINTIRNRLIRSESDLLDRLSGIKSRYDRMTMTRLIKPIESVGCYVPGGIARYPSTLLMCCIPANVAGVKRLVVLTPPQKDGTVDPLTLVGYEGW